MEYVIVSIISTIVGASILSGRLQETEISLALHREAIARLAEENVQLRNKLSEREMKELGLKTLEAMAKEGFES